MSAFRPLHRVLALALVAGAAGCAPSVSLPVLEPAIVNVPADVQVVAVIDRSAPKNAGQSVIGAIEGAVTGETVGGDREGRQEAINGIVYILQESPRFEVVVPAVTKEQVESGVFDREWKFGKIKRLCREHGCDAVVALEAFDTDVSTRSGLLRDLEAYKDYEGDETHYAERDIRVLTAWRMYDARHDRTFDELRGHARDSHYMERATSVEGAIARLPTNVNGIRNLGRQSGEEYGRRIAPSWRHVRRTYYAGGDALLKQGKNYVKARDWEGAVEIWRRAAESPDPKVRGKARYNLALAAEMNGELDKALDLAKKAAVDLANARSRGYVSTIQQRKIDYDRLVQQLAPPPEPAPEPEAADEPERQNDVRRGQSLGRPD